MRTNRTTLLVALDADSTGCQSQGVVAVVRPDAPECIVSWLQGNASNDDPVIIGDIERISCADAFGGRVVSLGEDEWDVTNDGVFRDPQQIGRHLTAAGLRIKSSLGMFCLLGYLYYRDGSYSREVYIRAGPLDEYSIELQSCIPP